MDIGRRLAYLRKVLKINQTDLAMLLNCTQANISYYEKNSSSITMKTLIALKEAYSVNLNWLIAGEGEMIQPYSSFVDPNKEDDFVILKRENNELKDRLRKSLEKIDKLKQKIMDYSEELIKLQRLLIECQQSLIEQKNGQ